MNPYVPGAEVTADSPAGTFSKPGNFTRCCTTAPRAAIIATRPCLISAARKLLNPSLSPTLENPAGSKKPKGAIAPTCFAGSNGGGGGGVSSASSASGVSGSAFGADLESAAQTEVFIL